MNHVDIIENLRDRSENPVPHVVVDRHIPCDFPSIEGFKSTTVTRKPYAFRFYVSPVTNIVSIRLAGTSLLQEQATGKCMFIQPGTIALYRPGDYETIFGRGSCTTLFMSTDSLQLNCAPLLSVLSSKGSHVSTIDLKTDPILEEIEDLCDKSKRVSYFKFAITFYSLLDRSTSLNHSIGSYYGVHLPAGDFSKLSLAVIAEPSLDWTTQAAAEYCGYSLYHFSRKFKAECGSGFQDFVSYVRATTVVRLMCEARKTPEYAVKKAGLISIDRASRLIREEFGFTLAEISAILSSRPARSVREA
jgi:AraC-like DNA-binding protein